MVAFSGPGLHEEAAGKSAVKVREAVTGRLCIIDGPPERTAPTFGDVTLAVFKGWRRNPVYGSCVWKAVFLVLL